MYKKKLATLMLAVGILSTAFLMPVNAFATTYKGIDVYEYDNISDYHQLKTDGVQVVIQKASEGLYHNDSLLSYRYQHLTTEGFQIGFYNFADNDNNPEGEAAHFISQIKGLHSNTVYWLDIENESAWTKQQAIDFTNKFITYMQSKGYKCGVYTGLSFYYEYLQRNIPSDIPIWLASYGKQPLKYPDVSWQQTGTGKLAGIIGNVDIDSFNDSIFLNGQAPPQTQESNNTTTREASYSSVTATLQSNLAKLLQWDVSVDGIPGAQTTSATKQFQHMVNLKEDGIPGTKTNSAINTVLAKPTLKHGSTGTAVRYLQYRLGITADGKFGEQTRRAVVSYEISHNLKVDNGIVGQQMWSSLLK